MKKTGNRQLFFISVLFLLLILPVQHLHAQQPEVEATVSETKVFTGEQMELSIQVKSRTSHNVELPLIPEFSGFRLLSTNPSRSTSISIVNNQTTRTTTYTYLFVALEPGNYTIPPVTIMVDGESRQTQSIPVEVVEKGALSSDGPQLPDIFVQIELDEENPVAGQQVVASVVLYFKQGVEVTSFQPAFGWQTDGFWKEELENISQPRAESTIKNGVRYRKATLLRYALFPSRGGEFVLSEYGLRLGIRSQPRRNDPFGSFFGGAGSNQRRVNIQSEPLTVNVRSLPSLPANSIGMNAVGDLRVERSIDTNRLRAGDSIELVTKIEGTGNIPLIRRPQYSLPDNIDTFNPRESSDVERRGLTIRGSKTYTEFLVSRAPGNFTLPEERIAIYDPQQRRYRTVTLPAINFEVLPALASQATSSGDGRATLQPVTGLAVWYSGEAVPVYRTAWFWIFLLIPVFAVATARWRKYMQDKLLTDATFRRRHFSYQTAKDRIKNAETHLKNDQTREVYRELHRAISGYITDKLGLPEAGLSDEELLRTIEDHSVNGQITGPLKFLLDKCNTISYAPEAEKEDIISDIEKTELLINQLKQKL